MWKVHLIEPIEGVRIAVTIVGTTLKDAQTRALASIRRVWPTARII